jgi:hypothetical protein
MFPMAERLADEDGSARLCSIEPRVLNFELNSNVLFSRDVYLTRVGECRNLRAMRAITIGLILGSAVWLAHAQAESSTPRVLSLRDCIQESLQHNLHVQIKRCNPQISLYNLKGSYADYDPTFNISGQHNFGLAGGGFNPVIGTNTPGRTEDQNDFSSSLGGLLPWGLNYSLSGDITESAPGT